MVIRLTLALLIISTSFFSALSKAAVEVTINETVYSYPNNPRLSDVLRPVALQEKWYWPESKLFRNNTKHSQELREQIIQMLAMENSDKNKSIYPHIISQIKNWEVADRITVKIDFELARISAKNNPRLDDGQYRILLSKRPANLYVFGAIVNALDLPYTNNTCIEDIVSKIEFSAYADKSYVYTIDSLGKIEKSPIAYWNSQCTIAKPGATLYVPLQESLFSNANTIINAKIVELSVNRITVQ